MQRTRTLYRLYLLVNLLAMVYAPPTLIDGTYNGVTKRGDAVGGVPDAAGGGRRAIRSDMIHAKDRRETSPHNNRKDNEVGRLSPGDEPFLLRDPVPYEADEGCFDVYDTTFCRRLASQGQCEKIPEWIIPGCRESCGVCGKGAQCLDYHDDCQVWAAGGQCKENPGYMDLFCRWSCELCEDDDGSGEPSVDTGPDHSKCWHREEWCGRVIDGDFCKNNTNCETDDGVSICPHACGICGQDPGCTDYNDYCPDWADDGECQRNPGYMKILCRPSCGCC